MAMSPAEAAYQLAHANQSELGQLIGSTAALTALATVLVTARFVSRVYTKVGLRADDWAILIALILCWGSFVTNVYASRNGLGRHLITVTPEESVGLEKSLYANVLLFPISVCIIQISFLLFYNRIFTLQNPRFRIALYVCAALPIGVCVSQVPPTIWQCTPVAFAWNKTIEGGKCINVHIMWIVQDILLLVVDVLVVALPLPLIWHLQITKAEKLGVSTMFLLVVNLIRLPKLIHIPLDDFTYTDIGAAIWSQAETCLGIVAACLPSLRPLLLWLLSLLNRCTKWSYPSWRRSKSSGTYQMHSVQKRDTHHATERSSDKRPDSATNRLGAFAHGTWSERPAAPYEACYHTSYQGDKIKEAAKEGREGGEDSSEMSVDVEKGING